MKFVKLSFFLLGALMLMTPVAKAQENQVVSTITVQGASTLEVVPDQAAVSIGVTNSAPTVNEAQEANAKAAALIEQKLLQSGIHKDKLRTAQYSISPLYTNDQDNAKTPVISGYQASNIVEVTVEDISSVGTIIDAAASAGANQISGIHFTKKDELELKQTVLKNAVTEAAAKAEAIAKAVNKQITRIVTITENGVSVQSPGHSTLYDMSLKRAAVTPIQPGKIEIQGSVTIIFEIQ